MKQCKIDTKEQISGGFNLEIRTEQNATAVEDKLQYT